METSSTRKIYVDSRRKTPSSESTSDFFFELNRSVTLPRKCVAFVTDIHLPHSWYNVDTHAQFLYIQEHSDVVYSGQVPPQLFREGVRRVQIPAGHYTGTDLAAALQLQLRTSTVHAGLNTYNVAYSSITGKIEISLTNDLDSANVLPLTHIVSLGAPTGSHWKIYNAEVENSPEFLTRTGALTYTYTAQNQPHTMTISEIDYANRTFKAVTTAGSTYRWNNTLERLENVANNWNWRPQFTLSFNLLNNYFSVLTDHQLSQPAVASQFTVAGIPLNRLSPSSINHLLRHDGHGPPLRFQRVGNMGSFLSGVLDLTGQSPPLYIASPNMTAFGTSMGPIGEHTIMRCICPDGDYGGFGGHIVDTLQNEQDYFVCGGATLKTLRFCLMDSTGQIVNLNGANWSFSIIFQDMA